MGMAGNADTANSIALYVFIFIFLTIIVIAIIAGIIIIVKKLNWKS